jgi:hypothetical protein
MRMLSWRDVTLGVDLDVGRVILITEGKVKVMLQNIQ